MAVIPPIGGFNKRRNVMISVLVLQILIIILFAIFVRYHEFLEPQETVLEKDATAYMLFTDTHVMIIIGFGFLMTFMKRYMFGGVGFNFLLAAMCMQWAILAHGLFNITLPKWTVHINVEEILEADVATAAVLISMGAVLGRTTFLQLLFMGVVELVFHAANKTLNNKYIMAADAGESIFVHVFGAYFGLAVSYIINKLSKNKPLTDEMQSSYNSDTFAMIGTLFLWVFWPSFNAGTQEGQDARYRAVVNTYIALCTCTVSAFAFSWILSEDKKFDMVHVQNSTLAGGVAVGAISNLYIYPVGAAVIGFGAGMISVIGYKFLTPRLDYYGIPDTCGVHNLHGMPGVLSGLISIIVAMTATTFRYHEGLYRLFPARAPTEDQRTETLSKDVSVGLGRTAYEQAGYQALALIVTMVVAILGGLFVGTILSSKLFEPSKEEKKNHDRSWWLIHDESVTPQDRLSVITDQAGDHQLTNRSA